MVVTDSDLGYSTRLGSWVRRGNGSGNQARWREVGTGWLLLGLSSVEMWRQGDGSMADGCGIFNVSVMRVEGD
jgi:hypothetical protein